MCFSLNQFGSELRRFVVSLLFLSRSELTPLSSVGASLLAKNSQTPRTSRISASSLAIFASKLAPTVGGRQSGK
ncbi:hypothetical protein C1Y26_31580 [Pseudomonas sp. MPR-R2A7]|nr:hypothetical protein C1Y23_24325 [Pseudomonas sp. GW460-12]PMX32413.1 hypothetical protein C1Y24_21415 [Pseudomonas sp. MPR-R2A4]PMX32921.1 hypothetical protein C1Y26_31580 [Pseudomonas sp. MPR-R2A7]PMX54948.1 hypothetical protein C1Y17_05605 [Pseudomonas sp. MPR-R2A6]PMX88292.1 hypothetical protein C1Y21_21365 [Pseudomonas sp. MPR-R2A3]PMY15448.1 hypothetical protein C1Y22_05545 [Pseudomonas sp. MPR-R2A5]PNA30523.1 hypothetical protein C1Y16_22250 [Pseudomonas sp. MPR-ANB1]PNA41420.1 hyp